ncbi:MAG: TPM domain-containing protein [Bacilli bacterium]|nr:TPM domain-containing protein [Bacilli bacterium]
MKVNKILKVLIVFVGLFTFINVYAVEDFILGNDNSNVTVTDNNVDTTDTITDNNYSYTNEKTSYKALIIDEKDLLSEDEEKSLTDDLRPLTEKGHIAFISTDCPGDTASCARSRYHELFNTDSGTIFLIDMENRYLYIFSDGANYKVITSSKAEIITDNVYRYASKEDYYECAHRAFYQMNTLLNGGKISEPMRHITNALLSLYIGFLVCFIFALVTFNSKRDFNLVSENYVKDLALAGFVATVVGTRKKYNPPVDSGSGFSGGGGGGFSGGGGGGFSGGGGGHGF